MNATICRRTALNKWSGGRGRDSLWVCLQRSRGRMVIIRSSSCSAGLSGIVWMQERRLRRDPSTMQSWYARRDFSRPSDTTADKRAEFQALYQELVNDDARNRAICDEIVL